LKLVALQTVGADVEFLQQLGCCDDLAQDGAAAHQLHAQRVLAGASAPCLQQVQALAGCRLAAFRHARVRVILVHHVM
jgi:hypothetical protein